MVGILTVINIYFDFKIEIDCVEQDSITMSQTCELQPKCKLEQSSSVACNQNNELHTSIKIVPKVFTRDKSLKVMCPFHKMFELIKGHICFDFVVVVIAFFNLCRGYKIRHVTFFTHHIQAMLIFINTLQNSTDHWIGGAQHLQNFYLTAIFGFYDKRQYISHIDALK